MTKEERRQHTKGVGEEGEEEEEETKEAEEEEEETEEKNERGTTKVTTAAQYDPQRPDELRDKTRR